MSVSVKPEHKNYIEGLVESIKVVGQMLIDNAEDLAGKMDMMTGFRISAEFDQEAGSIPEITVTRSHVPPKEEILRLFDIYKNGKHGDIYPEKECEIHGV